jgi:hypothetical protein
MAKRIRRPRQLWFRLQLEGLGRVQITLLLETIRSERAGGKLLRGGKRAGDEAAIELEIFPLSPLVRMLISVETFL